jgi:hypothetical protein
LHTEPQTQQNIWNIWQYHANTQHSRKGPLHGYFGEISHIKYQWTEYTHEWCYTDTRNPTYDQALKIKKSDGSTHTHPHICINTAYTATRINKQTWHKIIVQDIKKLQDNIHQSNTTHAVITTTPHISYQSITIKLQDTV